MASDSEYDEIAGKDGFRDKVLCMANCLIGLGSNQGDREATIAKALDVLRDLVEVKVVAQSRLHVSQPAGGPMGQSAFFNAAAILETSLAPLPLLELLKHLEQRLGRVRGVRWGPRPIDLDLLLYDNLVFGEPGLTLPHPRMAWRRFVLAPAVEIASDWIHPLTGWTTADLLAHLDRTANYVALSGVAGVGKTRLARRLAAENGLGLLPDLGAPAAAGDPWKTEIEFLEARAERLAEGRAVWRQEEPVVSDFWLGQSWAYAHTRLPAALRPEFDARWHAVNADAVRPRLVVILQSMASGTTGEEPLAMAIEQAARLPDQGPVLWLDAASPEAAYEEIRGAVAAMQ